MAADAVTVSANAVFACGAYPKECDAAFDAALQASRILTALKQCGHYGASRPSSAISCLP